VEIPHRITGTLAIYDIDKRNVIVSQYNASTGLTDYRTAGRARSRGVELDLAGQITDRLSTIASYAYTDAKTTEDPLYAGNQLANVAKNTASFSAVYDLGRIAGGRRLRIGGGPRYVGRRAGIRPTASSCPAMSWPTPSSPMTCRSWARTPACNST
jgi:iron complex outermembrane receptor protein